MLNIFQKIILKLKYKKISWRAKISKDVSLFPFLEIGPGCEIKKSVLKNNVFVYNDSVINQTTINSFCKISSNVSIIKSEIGSFSYISENCRIYNSSIGKYCSIGSRVIIAGGKHPVNFLSTNPVFYSTAKQNGTTFSDKDYFIESEPVIIGNDVWIGANSYISDGIEIGNGAIIGAGSVVTKNIAPYSVVGGVPAKEIKKRFSDEKIYAIEKAKWWEWDMEKLQKNIALFQTPDFNVNEIK